MTANEDLSPAEYRSLAQFRFEIRRYIHAAELEARSQGIEPQQHQALLVMKGLPEDARPTIRELAGRMRVQHHSAVELINRLVDRGFALREHAEKDRREVLVRLTLSGEEILRRLSLWNRAEIEKRAPELTKSLQGIIRESRQHLSAP